MEPTIQISPTLTSQIRETFSAQLANRSKVGKSTLKERVEKLRALQQEFLRRKDDIRAAMQADFGKPLVEVDLNEIFPITSEIKHVCSNLADWMRPDKVATPMSMVGTSSQIRYEAKGVCLIIAPWNFPFNLTFGPLVSAIAAGNTVILKPSEYTPHSSALMAEIIEALFDENEVALFQGDHTVSAALLELPFHHIFFTGSPQVGKIVMRAAAENLSGVTLELGGKSPTVVDTSANLKEAARKVAWGKYLNCGQVCIAPDYLLVHESQEQRLVEHLKENVRKHFGEEEENRQASQDYARIVNSRHFERLTSMLEDALEKGAELEIGGVVDASENYLAPTILTNVTDDMRVMQEEIFGPILPIKTYTDLEDCLDLINSKEKPLAMYIFSKDRKATDALIESTSAGGTCINDVIIHYAQPNLPFGGINNSGVGKAHGFFGFQAFSNARSIVKANSQYGAAQLMYPPYTDKVQRMVDLTIKLF